LDTFYDKNIGLFWAKDIALISYFGFKLGGFIEFSPTAPYFFI
jgi:hypothetical protein